MYLNKFVLIVLVCKLLNFTDCSPCIGEQLNLTAEISFESIQGFWWETHNSFFFDGKTCPMYQFSTSRTLFKRWYVLDRYSLYEGSKTYKVFNPSPGVIALVHRGLSIEFFTFYILQHRDNHNKNGYILIYACQFGQFWDFYILNRQETSSKEIVSLAHQLIEDYGLNSTVVTLYHRNNNINCWTNNNSKFSGT